MDGVGDNVAVAVSVDVGVGVDVRVGVGMIVLDGVCDGLGVDVGTGGGDIVGSSVDVGVGTGKYHVSTNTKSCTSPGVVGSENRTRLASSTDPSTPGASDADTET